MLFLIFIAVIVIILWVYIRFAYKTPSNVLILQTSLNDFQFKLLLEKQPIVVEDRIDNPLSIWKGWFRYNMCKHFEITPDMQWIRNRYKHMLLHAREDSEVLLCQPGCKTTNEVPDTTEEVIAVKLYKGMSMIVPYRWYFTTNQPITACGIHDIFTYFLPA